MNLHDVITVYLIVGIGFTFGATSAVRRQKHRAWTWRDNVVAVGLIFAYPAFMLVMLKYARQRRR